MSGAGDLIRILPSTPTNPAYRLERPADAEGVAIDLQVASQQAVLALMRAEADALDHQAWLQTLNGSQRAAAAPKPFALCISRDVARGVICVACQ